MTEPMAAGPALACPQCGAAVNADQAFCENCGGVVGADGYCETCGMKAPRERDHYTEHPARDPGSGSAQIAVASSLRWWRTPRSQHAATQCAGCSV